MQVHHLHSAPNPSSASALPGLERAAAKMLVLQANRKCLDEIKELEAVPVNIRAAIVELVLAVRPRRR
jgi:hypothetical protein